MVSVPLKGQDVVVIGLGPMGRGIARVADRAGARVFVADVDARATDAGLARINAEAAADGEVPASVVGAELEECVPHADLVIEATVEDLDVKRKLLRRLTAMAPDRTVIASNTSSLSIGEMSQAFGAPTQVVGMHFFNPPTKMQLVEVIVSAVTSAETTARARAFVDAIGKTAVVCRDSPNFIVNRVCRPLYYEAQLLVTQQVRPETVDAAASAALGHPMGPLTLLDFTGLHTHLASSETALREFGDPKYRPIPLVRALVRAGRTGRAAGRGFYDYGVEKPRAAVQRVTRAPAPTPADWRVAGRGPDAERLRAVVPASPGSAEITLYCCDRPTEADRKAVLELAARGPVVVDSSDGHWLELLPAGVGWVHLHVAPNGSLVAEVVEDTIAGVATTPFTWALVDTLGAVSVRVPALPGLIVDRLAFTLVNEACLVVEEGTASADDVDTALKLGMNHARGPFEQMTVAGVERVYRGLVSIASCTGDPRYRPSQLMRRRAAAYGRLQDSEQKLNLGSYF